MLEDPHHSHSEHDAGATQTLQAIQAGGHRLLAIARQRIAGVLDALDAGDFRMAAGGLQEALSSVGPLANAQTCIAVADGSILVKAADLKDGMNLADIGDISGVEVTHCPAEKCQGHVKFKIGPHDFDYSGDAELYVRPERVDV